MKLTDLDPSKYAPSLPDLEAIPEVPEGPQLEVPENLEEVSTRMPSAHFQETELYGNHTGG